MVYIHGGVYVSGAGSLPMFSGDQLALTGELIVVTFNYRLGPLGFLTTGDLHAPGNNGLMDQVRTNRTTSGFCAETIKGANIFRCFWRMCHSVCVNQYA